jgi:uncharacterized membrane protein YgcG
MKKLLVLLAAILIASVSLAQDGKVVRRLQIRHADPQLIYLLLRGQTNFQTPPELSTLQLTGGGFSGGFGGGGSFSGGNGGFGNSGPGGGGRRGG